jgi:adenylosuccinate lyase
MYMIFSTLTAISPVDGRYRNKAENLAAYFSEYALIKYRVQVEIEYFITLSEFLPQLRALATGENKEALRKIYREFSVEDATRIKEIESVTNHDVKAVEYFIKEKFDLLSLQEYKEFIHFGLTSQDINNTSVPLSIKDALNEVYFPGLQEVIDMLKKYAEDWADVPMLAKTHGQPASPTRLGKEVMVFVYRLEQQVKLLKATPVSAKFGGATGNFNAHHVAFPEYDWKAFGNKFVNEVLGLSREEWTTQISNYDNMAAIFDGMKRIDTILIDLCRDFWQYVSMEYFKQKIKAGEVGSSAMPHKVNPIDFENAEGNLGMANAILTHLATKLPISRLQRDLTDSTVLRNVGVPMAHVEIAFKSLTKGLGKLLLNEKALFRDLDNCWAVVAEGIQTILRREGYPKPYEALKALTRTNEGITAESISNFIDTLQVSDAVKAELKAITPHNYTGI